MFARKPNIVITCSSYAYTKEKEVRPEHETTQTDGQKNIALHKLSHSDTPMCQIWHVYRKDQRIYGLGTNQCYKT